MRVVPSRVGKRGLWQHETCQKRSEGTALEVLLLKGYGTDGFAVLNLRERRHNKEETTAQAMQKKKKGTTKSGQNDIPTRFAVAIAPGKQDDSTKEKLQLTPEKTSTAMS